MKIISLVFQKGGAGKSLLAQALAVEADAGKGRAALIDADPQESCVKWSHRRASETPYVVKATSGSLSSILETARDDGIKFVIIDTPPHIGAVIKEAVRLSDLVVMPIAPTPSHLDAIEDGWNAVRSARKTLGVLNLVPADTSTDDDDAVDIIADSAPGLKIAKTRIHQRKPFWRPQTRGLAITDMNPTQEYEKALAEIQALWTEIKKELK